MAGKPLPLEGAVERELPPDPPEAYEALEAADADEPAEVARRLRGVVAAHPTFLEGWARLAQSALQTGDPVAAYAFARVGYHRGLDRARKSGWPGHGPLPWRLEGNRGFLRSVHELLNAANAIGEAEEAERCRTFLLELDPDDHLGVASR